MIYSSNPAINSEKLDASLEVATREADAMKIAIDKAVSFIIIECVTTELYFREEKKRN